MSGETGIPSLPVVGCALRVIDGRLLALIGEAEPVRVRLLRMRPRSAPDGELVAVDAKKREVWLWAGLHELDAASRAVAEAELAERYHEPVVTAIVQVKQAFGAWQVEVATAAGPRRFALRKPSRNVETMDDGRVLLRDVLGNRYVVPDPAQLDAPSRRELARLA